MTTKKAALSLLAQLGNHHCTVIENDKTVLTASNGESARLYVKDPRFYTALLSGSVATARAYIDGWWHTPDLYAVMKLAASNIDLLNQRLDRRGWRQLGQLIPLLLAAARRRLFSRNSSKKDIAAHYDLSNNFFSLFLDETLSYSCAVFPDLQNANSQTLLAASLNKLNRIANKLSLSPNDNLLDLGCGWGSMTLHAAQQYQCDVTGITLSSAQYNYLKNYISAQPSAQNKQIKVHLKDYRDFQPAHQFSKISSVEMIEAAGEQKFRPYFRQLRRFLRPNGLAQVQAILIPDTRYRSARYDDDFIRQYIFPGGTLPSLAVIKQAAGEAGLQLVDNEDIGRHYAPTLLAWHQRFNQARPQIHALGFDEQFCRTWEYYFCYCAGAFASGAITTAQLIFAPTPTPTR